ncbi:hypothetical protein VPH35_056776 [Triticum aestivum]
MKDEANEVVEAIAKKIVQDMPYEARVDAVVKYFAHERKMLLKKSLARRVHLIRSMYMKAVPSWCNNNVPCYQQIISKWIDPKWRAQHRMASERRALMGGPVNLQGNLNLHAYVQKKSRERGEGQEKLNTFTGLCLSRKSKNRERGEGQEKLNTFTGLCLSRKSKKPEGGWVNPGAGLRIDAYSGKFKEHNGPDSDPASQDIDATISLQLEDGKKGGRLYVGDGAIRKKDIPKLSHLRATTSSSGPAIELRPQPGLHMLHQLEANARLREEEAMKMQQALFQQQEFMVKQQAILQETFAQLRNNMQGSTLPVLPPLPTLPNFNFFSQSGQGSNNCVVGGSSPGQTSPVTPITVHVSSTSPQQ